MSRTHYERALFAWIKAAVAPLSPVPQVIYAPASGPKPRGPYVTLQVISTVPLAPAFEKLTTTGSGADFVGYVLQHYEGSVSVNVFGDGHEGILEQIRLAAQFAASSEREHEAGISIWGPGEADLSEPAVAGTQWEGRSRADFRFSFAMRLTDTAEAVASSESTFHWNEEVSP